ncbi:hypothetical protein [Desulfobulbus alkaliphilus]|uniref:hypothetical protein n=1 Tax=Desulfobulbus alkaliphilus TaxID=869814 RepID=UPI0019633889|nr:hypothetical protein [Desulfobulbus alkaliphilus]MBM9538720.1 hypothetical protein [Desulfobulbus alkaliphilus]
MNLKPIIYVLSLLFMTATAAQAHTPLCACFDNGDNTITCEGGFSDGSSASGVAMRIEASDGTILMEGAMDADSTFTFTRPESDFTVIFDAGEGHVIEVPDRNIIF